MKQLTNVVREGGVRDATQSGTMDFLTKEQLRVAKSPKIHAVRQYDASKSVAPKTDVIW